jgi:hypothetical protein
VRLLANTNQVEAENMTPVQKLPFESLSSVCFSANPFPFFLDIWDSTWQNHALAGPESDVAQPRQNGKRRKKRESSRIAMLHCDIIADEFWNCRPYLLQD